MAGCLTNAKRNRGHGTLRKVNVSFWGRDSHHGWLTGVTGFLQKLAVYCGVPAKLPLLQVRTRENMEGVLHKRGSTWNDWINLEAVPLPLSTTVLLEKKQEKKKQKKRCLL